MRPVGKFDRLFSPTYNQLLDFYFKYRRPPAPYPNARQTDKDAYPALLEEWKQRMCKIEGLCLAQADTRLDIPPGYQVVPPTPATTAR